MYKKVEFETSCKKNIDNFPHQIPASIPFLKDVLDINFKWSWKTIYYFNGDYK